MIDTADTGELRRLYMEGRTLVRLMPAQVKRRPYGKIIHFVDLSTGWVMAAHIATKSRFRFK